MSETEFCFGAEITCGGVAFQTEAAFISISENNNFTYLSASKIIRLRYCCGSFPIKPSAFTGCSGKLSYQYVICFLQTSHDQIWQQKQVFYIRIELYFTPVLLTWVVIQEYAHVFLRTIKNIHICFTNLVHQKAMWNWRQSLICYHSCNKYSSLHSWMKEKKHSLIFCTKFQRTHFLFFDKGKFVTHINCVCGGFQHNNASLVMILMSWLSIGWLIVNILRQ